MPLPTICVFARGQRFDDVAVPVTAPSTASIFFAVLDYQPLLNTTWMYIGYNFDASQPGVQATLREFVQTANRTAVATSGQQLVTVTPLVEGQFPGDATFSMYSTVYDDDPTGLLLSAGVLVSTYTRPLFAKVAGIAVKVADHAGGTFSSPDNACTMTDAVQVLSKVVTVVDGRQWQVQIGQCQQVRERVCGRV